MPFASGSIMMDLLGNPSTCILGLRNESFLSGPMLEVSAGPGPQSTDVHKVNRGESGHHAVSGTKGHQWTIPEFSDVKDIRLGPLACLGVTQTPKTDSNDSDVGIFKHRLMICNIMCLSLHPSPKIWNHCHDQILIWLFHLPQIRRLELTYELDSNAKKCF